MRRSDREIRDIAEIINIIETCDVCRLALLDGHVPYIVPLNFGYEFTDNTLILYFHSANEGKKLDLIAKNPLACFEMDCSHKLIEAEEACGYTMEYESVIGRGRVSICSEKSEKIRALGLLMKQYAPGKAFHFPDHALEAVTVFKLVVSELSGKRLKRC